MKGNFVFSLLAVGVMVLTLAASMTLAQPAAAISPQDLAPGTLPDTFLGGVQRADEISASRAGNALPDTFLALREAAVAADGSMRMMPDTVQSLRRLELEAGSTQRVLPDLSWLNTVGARPRSVRGSQHKRNRATHAG